MNRDPSPLDPWNDPVPRWFSTIMLIAAVLAAVWGASGFPGML